MITLIPVADEPGAFTETDADVIWTRTSYTEPRELLDDCTECGKPIEEWVMFLCLDGGETAHNSCVTIVQIGHGRLT